MTREPKRDAKFEPVYDVDQRRGATVEVFYNDHVLAGMRTGWFWWSCRPGHAPEWPPVGPFGSSYLAYRDALGSFDPRHRSRI
jgi:hypothetical protein